MPAVVLETRIEPRLVAKLGANTAGEDELAWRRVMIDGVFDRGQHFGDLLPFVEEDGTGSAAQCGVGISPIAGGDSGLVEPDDLLDVPGGGRRLPGSAGTGDHDCREVGAQLSKVPIGQTRSVRGVVAHAAIRCWNIGATKPHTDCNTNFTQASLPISRIRRPRHAGQLPIGWRRSRWRRPTAADGRRATRATPAPRTTSTSCRSGGRGSAGRRRSRDP
jgi:hypothetical protein